MRRRRTIVFFAGAAAVAVFFAAGIEPPFAFNDMTGETFALALEGPLQHLGSMPEAPLEPVGEGVAPSGEGWFVVNARDARWLDGHFGAYTRFEGDVRFRQVGINIGVLEPGQPACYYHGEANQEDFLVLAGECVLLIEGEERQLSQWDFVHCPAWCEHVFVGAGSVPCAILAIGARENPEIVYPANELAQRHGAAVSTTTTDPKEAYAAIRQDEDVAYRNGWLPG